MKRIQKVIVVILFAVMAVCLMPKSAEASSASAEFTTETQQVNAGSEFTVVCRVSSSESFSDVEMNVLYDASVMEFVKGGKKVSGGNGVLHISSTGNETQVKQRTYSLQFKALSEGTGAVELDSAVSVKNTDGTAFSVSSNRLLMTVVSSQNVSESPAPTGEPEGSQITSLSTNNKLKALRFDCLSMTPEFDSNVLEYTVTVDCNTNLLYFNYIAANSKSVVRIKNNEELLVGENDVRIVVTAQSGDKRVYRINVVKESESETKIREQQERESSDITFSVYEKEGSVFIQNQYQFEVVDVEDDDTVPSGYVKTTVELEGKSVTAYTMENDLDNNYLLLYLKGENTEPALYQYDRQEKTIQKYTGTMTQKINKGGNVAQDNGDFLPQSGTWLYVAVIALTVVVILLLIIILNMVLKRKLGKGKKELDDMDF